MSAIAQNLNAATSLGEDIRVMIVDDSVVVRGLVSRWVEEEEGLVAVGKYSNGQKAVEAVATVEPDVVILDIEMPVMNGMEALPQILKLAPGAAVIMASTLTQRNAEISLKALSLGAADYLPKPVSNSGVTTSGEFRTDLIVKIRALGERRRKMRAHQASSRPAARPKAVPASGIDAATRESAAVAITPPTYNMRPVSRMRPRVLVIGSSTGGPPALIKILENLAPFLQNIPVLITQHMPATFTGIFAGHLAKATKMPATEGIDGERLKNGHIYVAPGGYHMSIDRKGAATVIRITDGPEINFCKPAVDPLFTSATKFYGSSTLGVVLTGMGADGSSGAVDIANAGGTVIAQDEETSVVWGMPGATAKAGACSAILPLPDIAKNLKKLIQGSTHDPE